MKHFECSLVSTGAASTKAALGAKPSADGCLPLSATGG